MGKNSGTFPACCPPNVFFPKDNATQALEMPVSVNAAYLNEWTVDSWFYNSVYRYLSELFKYKVWRFTVKSELDTPRERRIEHIFISNVQSCHQCGVGSRSPAFCFCYDVLQIKLRSQCSKSSVLACNLDSINFADHSKGSWAITGKEVPKSIFRRDTARE